MISYRAPAYTPRYLGQPVVTPTPVPALVPTGQATGTISPNLPLIFSIAAIGGAAAGWLLSTIYPMLDKRMKMDSTKKLFGTIGGALGGLAGTGTVLLFKD